MLRVTGAPRFPWVYNNTTVASANIEVDINGTLRRSTSSIKIKKDVDYNGVDPNLALQFKPVSFTAKDDDTKHLGFIAEDMRDIDERFVNDDKELPGLEMNAIVSALTSTIKEQQKEIDDLKQRIDRLEALLLE